MFIELPEQLLEKWRKFFPIVQGYLELREKREDVPFATLLNTIAEYMPWYLSDESRSPDPDLMAMKLSHWVKSAAVDDVRLVSIDGSTAQKLCSILADEQLFENCPICLEILNTELATFCANGCKKAFHEVCVVPWIRAGNTCPHCRHP